MPTTEMIELVDVKLITCIVQREKADSVIEAAVQAGAQGATVYYGVGMGVREHLGAFGVAINVEKEIVELVVANTQAEIITDVMYKAARLDLPGNGIIFISNLDKASTFLPKNIVAQVKEVRE